MDVGVIHRINEVSLVRGHDALMAVPDKIEEDNDGGQHRSVSPLEYVHARSRRADDSLGPTHRTNIDSDERIIKGDVMQAAVIMASFVYHSDNGDDRLPRKALPKPRKPREPTAKPKKKAKRLPAL